MIQRQIEPVLNRMAQQFKAVAITGPRQSGKTTLCQLAFPDKPYVSLESPIERDRAIQDPLQFLGRFPEGCILDEVQRVPSLFSYLQEMLDETTVPGRYILTGSAQFGLLQEISQTLAGRVGMLNLLPFSLQELESANQLGKSQEEVLWSGAYPPIYDQNIEPVFWYDSYINTYLERDVRQIIQVKNLSQFQRFLSLCAGNIGQLFNASRIGNDCSLNHGTISKWLSVLETSYVAFRLQPHYRNYRKRLIKTPKLYFWDVGVAVRLLGIESPQQLETHPLRGALFENWVIVELLKGRFNRGLRSNLYFWRNNTGVEIDVIAETQGKLLPIEIKSGATFTADWLTSLDKWKSWATSDALSPKLIYGGNQIWEHEDTEIIPWKKTSKLGQLI